MSFFYLKALLIEYYGAKASKIYQCIFDADGFSTKPPLIKLIIDFTYWANRRTDWVGKQKIFHTKPVGASIKGVGWKPFGTEIQGKTTWMPEVVMVWQWSCHIFRRNPLFHELLKAVETTWSSSKHKYTLHCNPQNHNKDPFPLKKYDAQIFTLRIYENVECVENVLRMAGMLAIRQESKFT